MGNIQFMKKSNNFCDRWDIRTWFFI